MAFSIQKICRSVVAKDLAALQATAAGSLIPTSATASRNRRRRASEGQGAKAHPPARSPNGRPDLLKDFLNLDGKRIIRRYMPGRPVLPFARLSLASFQNGRRQFRPVCRRLYRQKISCAERESNHALRLLRKRCCARNRSDHVDERSRWRKFASSKQITHTADRWCRPGRYCTS